MNFDNTLTVKYFTRPNGHVKEIEMSNIYPEDIEYFQKNNITVSMEELSTGDVVVYACEGFDILEENEVMALAKGRSCQETMKELRHLSEEAHNV